MSQLSLATAIPVGAIKPGMVSAEHSMVIAVGHVSVGGVLSMRVTEKVHVAALPLISVAVKVTTVVPLPDITVPAGGDCTTVGAGIQLSETTAHGR